MRFEKDRGFLPFDREEYKISVEDKEKNKIKIDDVVPFDDRTFRESGISDLQFQYELQKNDVVFHGDTVTYLTSVTTEGSLWLEDGDNVYRAGGRVGVGKKPNYKLDVDGNGNFNGWVNAVPHYSLWGQRILHVQGDNNLWLGYDTGTLVSTGSSLTVCKGAGFSLTTSTQSSIFGYQAAYSLTTGGSITAAGYQSAYSLTTGDENSTYGHQSAYGLTTGTGNSVYGTDAGFSLGDADYTSLFGWGAGYNIVGGNLNSCFGESSGYGITTGTGNCVFGSSAGYGMGTNISCLYMGQYAGYNDADGNMNVGVGPNAAYRLISGEYNCLFGGNAGYGLPGGADYSRVCCYGWNSGYSLTTATDIILIGHQAGDTERTGVGTICIGSGSDVSTYGWTNAIAIGQDSLVGESNLCVLGKEGTAVQTWGAVRFREPSGAGSNYVALSAPATIASNVTWVLPNADAAAAGEVLGSDSSGNLDWYDVGEISGDHGDLGGLEDDDHTQYILADGTRAITELTLTPQASSSGPEGTIYYESTDDHIYVGTE